MTDAGMSEIMKQTVSLQNSRRQLDGVENLGADIISNLRSQRDIIANSKQNVYGYFIISVCIASSKKLIPLWHHRKS